MRTITLWVGLFSLLATVFLFRSWEKKQSGTAARILAEQAYREVQQANPDLKPTPEIILKETDFYLFGSTDIQTCRVQAQESKIHKNSQLTQCQQVTCTMTTNKNWIITLDAPLAIVDHKNKTILLPKTIVGSINQYKKSTQNHIAIQAQQSTIDLKKETVYLQGEVISTFQHKKKAKT